MIRVDIHNQAGISRTLRRSIRQQEKIIFPPLIQDLSTDRPVLRRQLYRSYRGWLAQLVKEQGNQIPSRNKMVSHLYCWDHRYRDEQTPELATLLLQEVPVAMMAALGRTCRDRRVHIDVRMVLARDYRHYRAQAREMVDAERSIDQNLRKIEEEMLKIQARKNNEMAERAEAEALSRFEEEEGDLKWTWCQKLKRGWSIFLGWLGWRLPTKKLEELAELAQAGRDDELRERFYEMGGTVTKVNEPSPPWVELGDTWSEEDGEIWNVELCYQGGKMVYVGNVFKDAVIRGKENPYFDPYRNLKPI